jgi:microfibrillar-associated protein 1
MAQPTQVKRYRAGKIPDYALNAESSETERIATVSAGPREDRRLARLAKAKAELVGGPDAASRRRQRSETRDAETKMEVEGKVEEADEENSRDDTRHSLRTTSEFTAGVTQQQQQTAMETEETEEEVEARRQRIRQRLQQRLAVLEHKTAPSCTTQGTETVEEEELLPRAEDDDLAQAAGTQNDAASEESEDAEDESSATDDDTALFPLRRPTFQPKFVPKEQRETLKEQERRQKEEDEHRQRQEETRRKVTREAALKLLEESLKSEQQQAAEGAAEDDRDITQQMLTMDDEDEHNEATIEKDYQQWRIRELKRIKREKEERDAFEQIKLEVERRRKMTDQQIIAENAQDPEKQKPRKKMKFLQKYYPKGAFFPEERKELEKTHDFAAPTGEDRWVDRTTLPKVMQVKNFGRAGRTKYTHLVQEDTTYIAGETPWNRNSELLMKYHQKMAGNKLEFSRPSRKKKN